VFVSKSQKTKKRKAQVRACSLSVDVEARGGAVRPYHYGVKRRKMWLLVEKG
jgi:hypothetical protein